MLRSLRPAWAGTRNPTALVWRVLAVATTQCHLHRAIHRSYHGAPADGASLWQLYGARRRLLKVRARLRLQHSGGESAWRRDHAPALCVLCNGALCVLCNGAAMKIRLMEQACACSAVRGAERDFSRSVLVSASSTTRVESACRRDHAPALCSHMLCNGALSSFASVYIQKYGRSITTATDVRALLPQPLKRRDGQDRGGLGLVRTTPGRG